MVRVRVKPHLEIVGWTGGRGENRRNGGKNIPPKRE
jgi:hypothetical protein